MDRTREVVDGLQVTLIELYTDGITGTGMSGRRASGASFPYGSTPDAPAPRFIRDSIDKRDNSVARVQPICNPPCRQTHGERGPSGTGP